MSSTSISNNPLRRQQVNRHSVSMNPNHNYHHLPGYQQQNYAQQRCRMNIQHLQNNFDKEPQILCEGLESFVPETPHERIIRRRRVAEALMKRDAPHLLDPRLPVPKDDDEDESTSGKGVSLANTKDEGETEQFLQNLDNDQNDNKPLDLSNSGKPQISKLKRKLPRVDPGVLAFPEHFQPGFVNDEIGFKDPNNNEPEFVSMAGLVTPRRRPCTWEDVFGEEPEKPESCQPWSKTVDQSDWKYVSDISGQSSYVSSPLQTRAPYSQRFLRAVSRIYREDLFPYKQLPLYDPMYGESDSTLPSLEQALIRDRAHRVQKDKQVNPSADSNTTDSSAFLNNNLNSSSSATATSQPAQTQAETAVSKNTDNRRRSSASEVPALATVPSVGPDAALPPPSLVEKKYVCSSQGCMKAYKNLQGLKNHVTKTHPGMAPPTKLLHFEDSTPGSNVRTPVRTSATSRAATPLTQSPSAEQPLNSSQPLTLQQQQARLPAPPPPTFTQTQAQQVRPSEPGASRPPSGPTPMEADNVNSTKPIISHQPVDQRMIQNIPVMTPIVSQAQQHAALLVPKIKCNYCTKSYKTQQNLSRHVREHHQSILEHNGQRHTIPSQSLSQTFYTTQQAQIVVEQGDGETSTRNAGTPVAIMRQVSHHNSQMVTLDHQGQQGQVMQMHYQVQPIQQQRQQQSQSMEVDGQGQFSQNRNTNQPGNEEVMIVEDSPPRTPGRASNDGQCSQQVLLQGGQLVRQNIGGNQMIRQSATQSRQVHYVPSQVHIIQGNGSTQMVSMAPNTSRPDQQVTTVYVRSQNGSVRPMTASQISRSSNQVITQPAYVYQQSSQSNSSGTTTRYIINASTSRGSGTPGRSTPFANNGNQPRGSNDNSNDSNDMYSSPPQLTPQQPLPTRHPGQQTRAVGQVFTRRVPAGSSSVRITQTPIGGVSKGSQIRYTVQVPQSSNQGNSSAGYVQGNAVQGNVQYVRGSGQIPSGGAVRFITTTNSSVLRLQGQRPVQQYTVSSSQQRSFATRSSMPRVRVAVPVVQGQVPIRRPRPTLPLQSQQNVQQMPSSQSLPTQTQPLESGPPPLTPPHTHAQ